MKIMLTPKTAPSLTNRSKWRAILAVTLLPGLGACKRQAEVPAKVPSAATAPQPPSAGSASLENEKAVLAELTQAVRRFGAEQQRRPQNLQELADKGYLPSIPAAPAGKKFVINKNLAVVLEAQ